MSQLVTTSTQINDIEALAEAVRRLGLTMQEGGRVRYYAGESPECDYVIKGPGRYDLGLKLQEDGSYGFVSDNEALSGSYGRNDPLRASIGENGGRLKQEYGAARIERQARLKGTQVTRTNSTEEPGVVLLTLEGGY